MRAVPGWVWGAILAVSWLPSVALTAAPVRPAQLGLCAACHGVEGRATVRGYPHLAGQDADYLLAQLEAYRDGRRDHAAMRAAVGGLRPTQLAELARWYASQDPCHVGTEQTDR